MLTDNAIKIVEIPIVTDKVAILIIRAETLFLYLFKLRILRTNNDTKFNAFAFMMGEEASSEDYIKASPIKQDLQSFPPCLLIHGSEDKVVPLSESTDFYEELQKHNRTAEIHVYADEDHAFDSQPALGRNVVDIQGIFFLKYL